MEPHWNHKPTNLIIEKLLYLRMPNSTFNQHSYSLVTSLVEHTQLARPISTRSAWLCQTQTRTLKQQSGQKKSYIIPAQKNNENEPFSAQVETKCPSKSCLEQSPLADGQYNTSRHGHSDPSPPCQEAQGQQGTKRKTTPENIKT